ncbi:nucleotide disphospho-sugar-binding domain-containing protein [Actinomycetes bacterium KLBMP 9759]
MSRVAMVVAPLHGHVNPALGTAAELVRGGHRVTVHLPERFRAAAEGVGADLSACADPSPPPWAATDDPLERFAGVPAVLADAARSVVPDVLEALAADPPDVLAYDQLSVAGRLVADRAPGRVVQLCTTYVAGPAWSPWRTPEFAAVPRLAAAGQAWAAAVAELAERFGTPRLEVADLLAGTDRPTVVFVPRVLHPAAATYGERFTFAGPALRPPMPGDAAELAALDLPADGPVVYVSMGTLFGDVNGLDEVCVAAFDATPWDVVLALPGATAGRRGAVRIRRSVPQLGVLRRSTIAVTHGGMGSVLEALAADVPLVVVPRVPEQEITANRLVALGAAVRLDPADLSPPRLRDAVDRVAADATIRRAVDRLGHAVRSSGGAAAAAAAIIRPGGGASGVTRSPEAP